MTEILSAAVLLMAGAQPLPSAPGSGDVTVDTSATQTAYRGSEDQLRVHAPRLEEEGLEVDGRLEEEAWDRAAVLEGFTQYEPTEGIPAAEETRVRVLYTDEAIYFGVLASDSRPGEIQSSVAERDRSIFGDDWVRVMLDTYNEGRQAYVFYVNPLGIQTDGLWIEGMDREGGAGIPIDFNPDFIWQSRGRVTADGWVAEIRVPYLSLQFSQKDRQDWGINVAREVRRLGYKQSWAPLSRSRSSTLSQSGVLADLRGLEPQTLLEVNPVATGKWTADRMDGRLVRDDPRPELGFNGRWGITQNLLIGVTVNPDFSQVEADAPQIDVNERFALFFPEKRPFFLDGTEVFQTPERLVHTRRIVDPSAGMKLTGKVGSLEVGYLGAVDESPVASGRSDSDAAFNLLRVRGDLGGGSAVGLLYTDRSLLDGSAHNRVLGADARVLLGSGHSLNAQLAGSWTGRDEAEGEAFDPLLSLELERSGREFGWGVEFRDVAPEFRTESGFIRRTGDARVSGRVRRDFYTEPGTFLERFGVEVRGEGFFTHEGLWSGEGPVEAEVELQPSVSLRGGRWIGLILRDGHHEFDPDRFAGYRVENDEGELVPYGRPPALRHMLAGGLMSRFRVNAAVSGGLFAFYRQLPIFSEGSLGRELQLQPSLNLQATDRLSAELSHTVSRLYRERDDSFFSSADASRLKVQYQFSRSLFFRAVGQFNLEERRELRDPDTGRILRVGGEPSAPRESGTFLAQLLLSYEPSPGTIFFVGWTRQEEGPETYAISRMEPASDGLFLKASVLGRL